MFDCFKNFIKIIINIILLIPRFELGTSSIPRMCSIRLSYISIFFIYFIEFIYFITGVFYVAVSGN